MATWFTGLCNTAFYMTGNVKYFCKIHCLRITTVQMRVMDAEDEITLYDTYIRFMGARYSLTY